MTSGVEITAPITLGRDGLGPLTNKVYTPYPFSQTFINLDEQDSGDIQPYMARVHSPVRVTFTPSAMCMKRKSRVTDAAKSAMLNYRPLKRGDHSSSVFRFRAPDATLPTLQYMSPWLSVTKADFKDPRSSISDFTNSRDLTPGNFRRSYTDGSIDITRRNTPALSRDDFRKKTDLPSQQRSRTFETRESSANTESSMEKRVKILDPVEADEHGSIIQPAHQSPTPTNAAKLKDIREPECGVNYYSGYLPPEYSDKIAEQLKITTENTTGETNENKNARFNFATQYYKPLIGDRSLFMHESYPTQPKIFQSDIDQLRLEGRKRLLKSHGQAPVHFSALKNRGTLARPQQKGVRLDEAVREQQRQTHTVKNSRQPGQATSVEIFQQQRERTYNLQNLAREMINN